MRLVGSLGLALFGTVSILLASDPPVQTPDTQTPAPTPIATAPINFFSIKCARCHGNVDSPDNSAFEDQMSDNRLIRRVKSMCEGPAKTPLAGSDLDALVAFVGTRQKGKPFLCWTKQDGQKISGETLAGSEVSVKVGKKTAKLKVSGTDWTYELPRNAKPSEAVLTATFEKQTVTLDLSKASFTN